MRRCRPDLKGPQLADFYYKRGQARSLLGRNEEALADAELAVSNMQGGRLCAMSAAVTNNS